MSAVVTYNVRQFCRARLKDASSGFNYQITQTAPIYGVDSFQISDQCTPPSLYLGRYDYPTLKQAMGVNFSTPCAVLSVSKADNSARQNLRVTPSTFSGQIIVSIDFYVVVGPQGNLPPDGEAMFTAVSEALVNTFNTPTSYGLMPPGSTYNNEVMVEQGGMEWQGDRWIQWIPCGLFFYQVS